MAWIEKENQYKHPHILVICLIVVEFKYSKFYNNTTRRLHWEINCEDALKCNYLQ